MTQFNSFVDDVSILSGLPNNEKLRSVIANFIINLPPTMAYFSKLDLANQIKKAASNQVAFEALNIIKQNEKTDQK